MNKNLQDAKSGRISGERLIFCSIAAQHDNLGDIAIRQTAIEWLGDDSRRMVIYTGKMPQSYIEAFDLPETAELISDSKRFASRFIRASLQRRAHLVFAPGPFQIRPGAKAVAKSLINLLNILLVRATGGHAIAIGRAVRGKAQPGLALERLSIRLINLFVVRDSTSTRAVGRPLRTAPDMAFGQWQRQIPGLDRKYVAISLRGDRPISESLIDELVSEIRGAGLRPIFVTQVMRDNGQHLMFASKHGAEICSWDAESHSEQLRRVDEIYAASHTVVSDRLHALIFGLRRGAIPIALERASSDKLSSTLAHIVPVEFHDPEESSASAPFEFDTGDEVRSVTLRRVAEAQEALLGVKRDVQRLM